MSELAKALLAFQKEAPVLHKGTEGQVGTRRYKYLGLDDAMAAIRPVLNKHGIVVMQRLELLHYAVPGGTRPQPGRSLVTQLQHAESGEVEVSFCALPDTDDMQALGSAITYARRYSLISMLGLVADEDDDGAKAQSRTRDVARSDTATSPSADEKQITSGQVDEIKALIGMLDHEFPWLDPEDFTWTKHAQEWVRDKFGKPSISACSMAEANQLREWLENTRLERKAAEDVPFG